MKSWKCRSGSARPAITTKIKESYDSTIGHAVMSYSIKLNCQTAAKRIADLYHALVERF